MLIATDVAARGIHVDDVTLVVHVDPPSEHKAYMHRSGRTARAGATGDVVTLVPPEQRDDVAKMTRKAGIKPKSAEKPEALPRLAYVLAGAALGYYVFAPYLDVRLASTLASVSKIIRPFGPASVSLTMKVAFDSPTVPSP